MSPNTCWQGPRVPGRHTRVGGFGDVGVGDALARDGDSDDATAPLGVTATLARFDQLVVLVGELVSVDVAVRENGGGEGGVDGEFDVVEDSE